MTAKTQTKQPSPPPSAAYGWCAWHQRYARGVRLIQVHEQGSGSGGSCFACPSCREAYDLVPLADKP
jgi:hypothetical protein